MKIKDVLLSKGLGGWYCDDKKAIKAGAKPDGYRYAGKPLTPGFKNIRQPGECVSIMLRMESGEVGIGDCTAVTYSGIMGRKGPLVANEVMKVIQSLIVPKLLGYELSSFCTAIDNFNNIRLEGKTLHPAIYYGITQAFLSAMAQINRTTATQIICKEYNLPLCPQPIPIVIQTGDDYYAGADKAIMKRVEVLPHALINDPAKLGSKGENLLAYTKWLRGRIRTLAPEEYTPIIHYDVYGTIGRAFNDETNEIARYLMQLEKEAKPYSLQIEGPIECKSGKLQMEQMKKLREYVKKMGCRVKIVADEWCNTLSDIRNFVDNQVCDIIQIKMPDLGGIQNSIEAVAYCKKKNVGAYLGGSCNETDISARMAVHVAIATQADQILARPGMGVDEAIMVTRNEMFRTLTLLGGSS